MNTAQHPLLDVFLAAARGAFPPVDGAVRIVPALAKGFEASIGFTGHAVIATALPPALVLEQGVDAFGGSVAPGFLSWLAGKAGAIGSLDVTLVARGMGRATLPRRLDLDEHPSVQHARHERSEVEVYGDERGLVTLARGLGGRRELSIEVDSRRNPKSAPGFSQCRRQDRVQSAPSGRVRRAPQSAAGCGETGTNLGHEGTSGAPGRALGRTLLRDALGHVPAGEPVFAAVAAGNARSLRAFLAVGFKPIGCEVVLLPKR